MTQTIYQVDAFTAEPFRGNPAGVCVLESESPEDWMQNVAAEMNLSETAFVVPKPGESTDANGRDFDLRWFTPTQEMYLCGHATLSAAHILWEQGPLPAGVEARFHTLSGLLRVKQDGGWIEMDFPAWSAEETRPPNALTEALGVPPSWFGRNEHFGMVLLKEPEQVERLTPNMGILRMLSMDGVIVTAQGDGKPYDFISRVFAPKLGIDEDPVTGGAHCMLTPFWSARLHKTEMLSYQASRRGGVLRVAPRDDRVSISGQAVTVLKAELIA